MQALTVRRVTEKEDAITLLVADWMERHPDVEIVARLRARNGKIYADVTRKDGTTKEEEIR